MRFAATFLWLAGQIGAALLRLQGLVLRLIGIEPAKPPLSPKFGEAWKNVLGWWVAITAWGICGLVYRPELVLLVVFLIPLVTGLAYLFTPWVKLPRRARRWACRLAWLGQATACLVSGAAWVKPGSLPLFAAFVTSACLFQGIITLVTESTAYRRRLCPHCRA